MSLVRATTTFHYPGPATVNAGAILDGSADVVRRYPSFFEPIEATAKRDGELLAATSRPGEKRLSRKG